MPLCWFEMHIFLSGISGRTLVENPTKFGLADMEELF
jgi:hypothetical protein